MDITCTQQAGGCIASIAGRIDSATSGEVDRVLSEQIARGHVRLVLDLRQVDYMSSSGLRVLMTSLKSARRQKGDLYLGGLQDGIRQLLDLAGFTSIFRVYPTVDEAVSALLS